MAAPGGYDRLISSTLAIVASFTGAFILSIIRPHPSFALVAAIVVLSYFIYAALDGAIRQRINAVREKKVVAFRSELEFVAFLDANSTWQKFGNRILVFILLTGVFLTVQIFLVILRTAISDSNLDTWESIVFLFVVIAFSIYIYVTYQKVTEDLNNPDEEDA